MDAWTTCVLTCRRMLVISHIDMQCRTLSAFGNCKTSHMWSAKEKNLKIVMVPTTPLLENYCGLVCRVLACLSSSWGCIWCGGARWKHFHSRVLLNHPTWSSAKSTTQMGRQCRTLETPRSTATADSWKLQCWTRRPRAHSLGQQFPSGHAHWH